MDLLQATSALRAGMLLTKEQVAALRAAAVDAKTGSEPEHHRDASEAQSLRLSKHSQKSQRSALHQRPVASVAVGAWH